MQCVNLSFLINTTGLVLYSFMRVIHGASMHLLAAHRGGQVRPHPRGADMDRELQTDSKPIGPPRGPSPPGILGGLLPLLPSSQRALFCGRTELSF